MTKAMKERERTLDAKWKDEGNGYFSIVGQRLGIFIVGPLAYIALPENHPSVNNHYDSHNPDVNGGLTFSDENVFGWDYIHAYNTYDIYGDISRAIEYFRKIEIGGE